MSSLPQPGASPDPQPTPAAPSVGGRSASVVAPDLPIHERHDEIVAATREAFADEPEFGPIDAFYQARGEHLTERAEG